MKKLILLLLSLSFFCLLGCGGNSLESEVKPLETKIKGFLGTYIEVENETYKIAANTDNLNDWEIAIKLNVIKHPDIEPEEEESIDFSTLSLDITNEKGMPISGFEGMTVKNKSQEKLNKLKWGNKGDSDWITFRINIPFGNIKEKPLPAEELYFCLNTVDDIPKDNYTESTESTNNETVDEEINTNPEFFDRLLDETDLIGKTKDELALIRNTIFAKHGYIFKKGGDMEAHFTKQTWYNPRYKNVNQYLTDVDKLNIEMIKRLEKESISSSTLDIEQNSTNTKGQAFDEWLDTYEKYMTEYVRLAKRAGNGDVSALTDYQEYAQKLTEAGRKLDNAKGEMTQAQINRLLRIQKKIANAAMR